MPKNSKDVQKESVVVASNVMTGDGEVKRRRAAGAKRLKRSSRKTAVKKSIGSRARSTAKSRHGAKLSVPSDEQIRLRAYFIAKKRTELSIPGNTDSDWVEAKRQLFHEAGVPLR